MGGSTNITIAAALHNLSANKNSQQWAHGVWEVHEARTQLQQSFTPAERHTAVCMAPRGNTIFSAGDPTTIVEDLPATIEEEALPELHESIAAPKGIRVIATKLRKLTEWRHFFYLHQRTPVRDQLKLLTHAGHGSVTFLQSDIPLGQRVLAETIRTIIMCITGAKSLGRHNLTTLHHCSECGVQAGHEESLERHVVRCPNGGMRLLFHAGLVGVIKVILREAGVPDPFFVLEARGLRVVDRSRHGDVVALDFFADDRHLVIDVAMTTRSKNTMPEKVATVPGYAAKQVEDNKFLADMTSRQPISAIHGGPHILVPFAIEDGGRMGAQAQALMRALATSALAKGRTPPFAKGVEDMTHPMLVSLWIRRWQQRISSWMHLAISHHDVRLLCPTLADQHGNL